MRLELFGLNSSTGGVATVIHRLEIKENPQAITRGSEEDTLWILAGSNGGGWVVYEVKATNASFAVRTRSAVECRSESWTPMDLAFARDGATLVPPGATPEDLDELRGPALVMIDMDGSARAFKRVASKEVQVWSEQLVQLPIAKYSGHDLVDDDGRVQVDAWAWSDGSLRASGLVPLIAWPPRAYLSTGMLTLPRRDSDLPGCVWHRVVLEADIPDGAGVFVWSRAADEDGSMEALGWTAEPPLMPQRRSELPNSEPVAPTWELLLQRATGRLLDLKLEVRSGNGGTPRLHSLYVSCPRFSYLREYLPQVWRREAGCGSFNERFLAIPEGWLTALEDRIASSQELFDPRTCPSELLPWLASWVGMGETWGWEEDRRRLLLRNAVRLFSWRGTRRGLLTTLRLALDEHVGQQVFENMDKADEGDPKLKLEDHPGSRTDPVTLKLTYTYALSAERRTAVTAIANAVMQAELPAHLTFKTSIEETP